MNTALYPHGAKASNAVPASEPATCATLVADPVSAKNATRCSSSLDARRGSTRALAPAITAPAITA